MLQGTQAAEGDAVLLMPQDFAVAEQQTGSLLHIDIISRTELERCSHWPLAFAHERKDRRYYEIVEDTLDQGFDYGYFALKNDAGEIRAIQPFFINDQDMLAGTSPEIMKVVSKVRRIWPRFLKMRTLMIGNAGGEGHLDARDGMSRLLVAKSLAAGISKQARRLKSRMLVFKEFPRVDRPALARLKKSGFARIPSMPMTRLKLDNFRNYEDYLHTLSRNTRSQLRRKFKESGQRATLQMRVVTDITPYINDVYPLYLAVWEKSSLQFEKATPEYFCKIGQEMPDKALFFLWLLDGKIVAFNYCLIHGDSICSEYLGFDYKVAFDLHLYYVVSRDVLVWAIANKYKWWCSTALNYEPKYRLRQELVPLDLYVRHASPVVNFIMKRVLPYLEPTRYDKVLQRFQNYSDLRAMQ
jgi:hypothetical protein